MKIISVSEKSFYSSVTWSHSTPIVALNYTYEERLEKIALRASTFTRHDITFG